MSDVNVFPWFWLEGAGQCPWRACRHLKPSQLNPSDLFDHQARNHGSDPAQREQAEAVITGVTRDGLAGLFAVAKAGSWTPAQPSGVQSSQAQEASSSALLSGARGSVAVSRAGGIGADLGAARSRASQASPAPRGACPVPASFRSVREGSTLGRAKGTFHPPPGAGAAGPPPSGGPDQGDDPDPAGMQ